MRTSSLANRGQNRVVSTQKTPSCAGQSVAAVDADKTHTALTIDPCCEAFPPMQHDEFLGLKAASNETVNKSPSSYGTTALWMAATGSKPAKSSALNQ